MSKLPQTQRTIPGEIRKGREQATRERNSSPFFGTGFHPNGQGGMDSDTYVPGVSGYSFRGDTGNAEFNDITLRGGIIGNDALTSPTSPEAIYAVATNFGVGTSMATKLTTTLAVPAGFSAVAITLTCRVFVNNPNTTGGYDSLGGDYMYATANIESYQGWALPHAISGNGGSGTNVSIFSSVLPGLTEGGIITLFAQSAMAFAPVAANTLNVVELSGMATWYR